jgi:hypothetical protein
MAKQRLVDRYPLQTEVEIMLGAIGWQAGLVIRHQHPGVWVRDRDGRSWFVTNGRRIRPTGSTHES